MCILSKLDLSWAIFMRFQSDIRNKSQRKSRELRIHPLWFTASCMLVVFFHIHHSRISSDALVRFAETNFGQQATEIKPVLSPQVNGGTVFRIPRAWNRLHSPWLKRTAPELKNPRQSRNRYLYGPSRMMTSDGIGHSMCAVNLEFNLALNFNVTYTHRVGFYSSLSRHNRMAVEEFFGWGVGEVPRTRIQTDGCSPKGGKWPEEDNLYDCHICEKPLDQGSLGIEKIVEVPFELLNSNCPTETRCRPKLQRFLEKNSFSNTIFQLPASICSPQKTDANFLTTRNLFYNKYWNKHGNLPWKHTGDRYDGITRDLEKVLPLSPRELNIAVHVRRGDFLEAKSSRKITKDRVFAKIICRVLTVIGNVGGSLARMPIAIHIYSEGQLTTTKGFSTHMVELQNKEYYDHNGEPRDESWWTSLITTTLREDRYSSGAWENRFRVQFHISEDTLSSLHNMNAADVFIGSHSGMSTHLVWSLSRGVSLLPRISPVDIEIGKKGYLCCSISFRNDDGYFSLSTFRWYWKAYAYANEESAWHSLYMRNESELPSITASRENGFDRTGTT